MYMYTLSYVHNQIQWYNQFWHRKRISNLQDTFSVRSCRQRVELSADSRQFTVEFAVKIKVVRCTMFLKTLVTCLSQCWRDRPREKYEKSQNMWKLDDIDFPRGTCVKSGQRVERSDRNILWYQSTSLLNEYQERREEGGRKK